MILISGPQVMQGYLNDREGTAAAIKTLDGQRWYVTGDKGFIDEDGFLTLIDRYTRFANLGDEVIGLSDVEQAVKTAVDAPNTDLMAFAVADQDKGK